MPKQLLDYLEHQYRSFEELPFTPVDAAALSQISMIRAEKVVPSLLRQGHFTDLQSMVDDELVKDRDSVHFSDMLHGEDFEQMFGETEYEQRKRCLLSMAVSPRFREVLVTGYISLLDVADVIQFSAMSFTYKDQFSVIAFRGTDATATGWKEDCAMAFKTPVPSQIEAVRYVSAIAGDLPGRIYLVGHSKGGNLAEYAAAKLPAKLQARIAKVYTLDGPGFKKGAVTHEEYAPVLDRIVKICPKDSFFGILLDSPAPMRVVPSSGTGLGEHSVFTWEVDDQGYEDFIYLDQLSMSARMMKATLDSWFATYSDEELEKLADSMYAVMATGNERSRVNLFDGGARSIPGIIAGAANADGDAMSTIFEAGRRFLSSASFITGAHHDDDESRTSTS